MLYIREKSFCDQLAQLMKTRPETFHGFELEYIVNGQRSFRRRVEITGDSITGGATYARLASMNAGSMTRYLNYEDVMQMVSESTHNVLVSVISDHGYVDTGDDISVSRLLEYELTREEISSRQLSPDKWESVFWDPLWARPDKLTSYLNEALSNDEHDNSTFLLSEASSSQVNLLILGALSFNDFNLYLLYYVISELMQATSSEDLNVGGAPGGALGFVKAFVEEDGSSSNQLKVNKTKMLKANSDKLQHIQWTGEVFRVKPLKLFRLNLARYQSRRKIAIANLQVHR